MADTNALPNVNGKGAATAKVARESRVDVERFDGAVTRISGDMKARVMRLVWGGEIRHTLDGANFSADEVDAILELIRRGARGA